MPPSRGPLRLHTLPNTDVRTTSRTQRWFYRTSAACVGGRSLQLALFVARQSSWIARRADIEPLGRYVGQTGVADLLRFTGKTLPGIPQ